MKRNVFAVFCLVLLMAAKCSQDDGGKPDPGNAKVTSSAQNAPQYDLQIFAAGSSNPVYGSKVTAPGNPVAGTQYSFNIVQANGGNFNYKVVFKRIDLPASATPAAVTVNFQTGANSWTALPAGKYSMDVTPSDSDGNQYPLRSFSMTIACPNPVPFNASGIDMSKVVVTRRKDNLFKFDVANAITPAAGGTPPYYCVLDANGDGYYPTGSSNAVGLKSSIQFPCADGIDNQYVNYVGKRLVQMIVVDSCQLSVQASGEQTFDIPTRTPGDSTVFVNGTVESASGPVASLLSFIYNTTPAQNVIYWATNELDAARPQTPNPVSPLFDFGYGSPQDTLKVFSGDNGTFTINTAFSYGLPGSGNFGLSLSMGKIHSTLDMTDPNNPVATASVTANTEMSSFVYTTDSLPPVQSHRVQGGPVQCQLLTKNIEVLNVSGSPCNSNQHSSAPYNMSALQLTVHAWGTYVCTNLAGTSATGDEDSRANISGGFDGIYDIGDGCSGGQGGGGGVPDEHV